MLQMSFGKFLDCAAYHISQERTEYLVVINIFPNVINVERLASAGFYRVIGY